MSGTKASAEPPVTIAVGTNEPRAIAVRQRAGTAPGLFWLGVMTPDQTQGAVLTQAGWANYQGGLYPFQARYDTGLPGTIQLRIPFPSNSLSTSGFVGYSVYAGHGAYTQQAQQMVAMLFAVTAPDLADGAAVGPRARAARGGGGRR